MKAVRPTVSTPHPALSSVEEEKESALRAPLHRLGFWNSRHSRYSRMKKCLLNPGGWRVGVVVPKTFQLRFVRRTVGDDDAVA